MAVTALRTMNLATRLLLAFVLPPTVVGAYDWAFFTFGFRRSELALWLVMLIPIVVGAALLASAHWPRGPKIVLTISYVAVMFGLVILVALTVSCSFGDCL